MTTLSFLAEIPSRRDREWAPSAEFMRDIILEHFMPGPLSILDVTYGEGHCWAWPWRALGEDFDRLSDRFLDLVTTAHGAA